MYHFHVRYSEHTGGARWSYRWAIVEAVDESEAIEKARQNVLGTIRIIDCTMIGEVSHDS